MLLFFDKFNEKLQKTLKTQTTNSPNTQKITTPHTITKTPKTKPKHNTKNTKQHHPKNKQKNHKQTLGNNRPKQNLPPNKTYLTTNNIRLSF